MPAGPPSALLPPLQGVRGDLPPYQIPDGYLWRSRNILPRFGRLVTRPGLGPVTTTGPGARLSGGTYFRTASSVERVIAATLTKWYRLNGTAWTDISGAVTFTGDADNPTRFAVFQQSGVNHAIGTNNRDALYSWDGSAGAITALGGTPPSTARDITTIGNYVVVMNTVEAGDRFTVRVRWSDFNNKDSWPALNFADLVALDAGDNGVAVRALGRLSMGCYLEDSVWLGDAQAGTSAFRFEMVARTPGPVSPAAVVAVGSQHFFLARDARIYRFDGYSCQPVSEPVDFFLQSNSLETQFRTVNRARAFGYFSAYDRNIWWFYPGPNSPDPDSVLSYNVDTGAWHLHDYAQVITAGWRGDEVAVLAWTDLTGTWNAIGPGTYPTWESFGGTLQATAFLGSASGQVYRQRYDLDDDGAAISGSLEFPLKAWTGLQNTQHLDGVESFFRQIPGGPLVETVIGTSEAFAEFPGPNAYVDLGDHDTALATRQKLDDNVDMLDTRFASLRLSYSTHVPVVYEGGLLYAWGEAVS